MYLILDDIEEREDISSDSQETHEEVKRKNIDDISSENSIPTCDIQEKCNINNYKLIPTNGFIFRR